MAHPALFSLNIEFIRIDTGGTRRGCPPQEYSGWSMENGIKGAASCDGLSAILLGRDDSIEVGCYNTDIKHPSKINNK